jgi:hypothetical protein
MRAARADIELRDDAVAGATRTNSSASVARRTMVLVWVPALLALVLLDVTFNLWFWRIPKLTGTSADYGYEFLLDARRLAAAPYETSTVQVLALGSSIAGAFDPVQVQALLRHRDMPDPGSAVRLWILHPGVVQRAERLLDEPEHDVRERRVLRPIGRRLRDRGVRPEPLLPRLDVHRHAAVLDLPGALAARRRRAQPSRRRPSR